MSIRQRVSKKVETHEDSAIRVALRLAITAQSGRNRELTEFGEVDSLTELEVGLARIKTWERMLQMDGDLRIVS